MLHVSPEIRQVLRKIQAQHTAAERARASVRVQKPSRLLSEDRFASLVAGMAIVLQTGTSSLFQFEGACRYGLRRVLVLQDWSWRDADMAAAAVVSVALMQIGAERPTWHEGQPEWAGTQAVDRTYCARCGKPLEEGRRKFCSKLCSNADNKERGAKFGLQVSLAEYHATLAERRAQRLKDCSKNCDGCGKAFIGSHPSVRYCSQRCTRTEFRKHFARACDGCGTIFEPKKGMPSKFCDKACYDQSRKRSEGDQTCGYCAKPFSKKAGQRYCSVSCGQLARQSAARTSFECREVEA
ncbi:hypothetical protein [Aureimonas ureilytica]|uniref:hypothetical protein n=1 Tax=Aureimonas ureilytica TaxID=401562 RepID=UPI00073403A5|nr:hypothetical protein [Aureimonas ureilytica]